MWLTSAVAIYLIFLLGRHIWRTATSPPVIVDWMDVVGVISLILLMLLFTSCAVAAAVTDLRKHRAIRRRLRESGTAYAARRP
ncbi:MAG: hypothetical protein AAF078_09365 [Planctomycetota bacterium]